MSFTEPTTNPPDPTSQNNDNSNPSTPTETESKNTTQDLLSPSIQTTPDSPLQDQGNFNSPTMGRNDTRPAAKNDGGHSGGHAANGDGYGQGQRLGEDGSKEKDHGLPGSSWNNKKANEDYERAMAGLSDKNFSMARWGELIEVPKK